MGTIEGTDEEHSSTEWLIDRLYDILDCDRPTTSTELYEDILPVVRTESENDDSPNRTSVTLLIEMHPEDVFQDWTEYDSWAKTCNRDVYRLLRRMFPGHEITAKRHVDMFAGLVLSHQFTVR